MRCLLVAVIALGAACGRLGFDSRGDDDDDTTHDPSLVLWFAMDDEPADGAADSSDRGIPGTCSTCPTRIAGVHGMAFRFDGATTMLNAQTPVLSAITVATWVRVDAALPLDQASQIAGVPFGNGVQNSWELFLHRTTMGVFLGVGGDSITPNYFDRAWLAPLGEWHHVAFTWDGTTIQLFLDAMLVGQGVLSIGFDAHALLVAGDADRGVFTSWFPGALDDFYVYDRALAVPELAALASR